MGDWRHRIHRRAACVPHGSEIAGAPAAASPAVATAAGVTRVAARVPTLLSMRELLALSEGLPLREVAPGEVLVREGERSGTLYVLERGALTVARAGVTIAVISAPGSLVGEVAVLVGGDHSATVTATIPSAVRVAEDGEAFLSSSPEVLLLVAKEVAHRLQGLVGYVVELKVQYSDGPGLEVMDEILARLSVWRTEAVILEAEEEPDPQR